MMNPFNIEDSIFRRKRMIEDRLKPFGFKKVNASYEFVCDFMDGNFQAVITLLNGCITGRVIDKMNDEEYAQLRNESFQGTYVNSVRNAYKEILTHIAEQCCEDVFFVSEQANRITDDILKQYSVCPDFPWGRSPYNECGTFRHANNRKWFALIMNIKWHAILKNGDENTVDVMNLKIDPSQRSTLLEQSGIYPAYHMNHKNWISVTLNDQLDDACIMKLVEKSYNLTKS